MGMMEVIDSDLTDVMRRVEPGQVITEQSQSLTININLELQKQRERGEHRAPTPDIFSCPCLRSQIIIVKIKPQCEQSSHCGKYCFQIIK